MILLFFLFLLLGNAVVIGPPSSGEIVSSSSSTFRASVYWSSAPGHTSPSDYPPVSSCSYSIDHGGSGTTSIHWNCYIDNGGTPSNTSDDRRVCNGYISIPVSGLVPDLAWWTIDCGSLGRATAGNPSNCNFGSSPPDVAGQLSCIIYDFQDPQLTVNIPQNGQSYPGPDLEIEYQVSDDNPHVVCKGYLDGAVVESFTHETGLLKTKTFTYMFENLPWGEHQLRILCNDSTRFYHPTAKRRYVEKIITFKRWVPDTVKIHLINPPDNLAVTSPPVTFRFWVNESPTQFVDCELMLTRSSDSRDLVYSIPNVENTTNPSSRKIVTFTLPNTVEDGKWDWHIECTDQGPKNTGTSETRTLWIDGDDPYKLEMIPSDGAKVSDLPFELKYRVWDLISPKLNCDLTSDFGVADSSQVNQGEWKTVPVSSITPGTHSWTVTCTDVAGNSITKTQTFTYEDVLPPIITLTSPTLGDNILPGSTVNFEFNVDDAGSYTCNVELKKPGGSFATIGTVSGTGSQSFSVSSGVLNDEGVYNWRVSCTDAQGNSETSDIWYFTVSTSGADDSSSTGVNFCATQPFHSELFNITLLFMALGVAIAVSGYLFGTMFNSQRTLMGAKSEFKSLIISAALLILVTGASSSLCTILGERMLNGWANLSALIDKLEDPTTMAALIYGKAMFITGVSPPQYQMNIPFVDVTYKQNLPIIPFKKMLDIRGIQDLLMNIAASYAFYDRMVSFLVEYAMQVLLFLGLILRMLPMTRRYGTTLVALSIVLIFILPFLYEATANLLYHLTKNAISTVSGILTYMHTIVDKYFTEMYNGIKRLKEVAELFNLLHFLWLGFYVLSLLGMRLAEFLFPPALPYFIYLVYQVVPIVYQAILAIGGIVWTLMLINVMGTLSGGINDVTDLYSQTFTIFEQLAYLNIVSIFFYVVNLLVILGATRAISLLGGGDYFLYGVEDHI